MAKKKRKPVEFLLPYMIATIIGLAIGVYLANFIFMKWQHIPMDYFRYDTLFRYKAEYGSNPKVMKIIKICMALIAVPVVAINAILTIALFAPPKREQHGSAKFANTMQIRDSGLLPTPKEQAEKRKKTPSNPSLLVGNYKGKLLEFFGNEFTFVAAPTRSGKGVGIVIPNLLHYTDSVVVLDIKNENWDITAGFRSQYQDCYLFCPKAEDGRSHRYNPLDYIDPDETKRMGDIQNIANIMYPADGQDAFWANNAQRLFTGLILYMMETPDRPTSLAELVKLSVPNKPLNEWIVEIIAERADPATKISVFYDEKTGKQMPYSDYRVNQREEKEHRPLSIECVESLMAFAGNSSENTRAGIQSTLAAPLAIFTDPMVACATSSSDFRLDEVRKKRMSIFVGIQPNELPRFDKLLNLFFSQLININTRVLPEQDPSLKYQCLVLLDEFTALGKVDIINKAVAYIAGYNMRLMLIFQNKSQCEQYYTREGTQTMLSNMACQIVFAPRTIDDAKSYSDLLGTETIKGRSVSRNRGGNGGGSVSVSDQSRALMLPQELMELEQSKEILIYNANKPILADKIKYYEHPILKKRQRLKIKESCLPVELDIKGMLNVMRGIKPEVAKSVEEAPTAQESLNTKHGFTQLGKICDSIGFDMSLLDTDNHPANTHIIDPTKINF